jgi:2-C-methyl-D-erythritol 2,4-cyclodiphosphate synthase
MRIGLGIDAHRFAESRALVLGGVEIPFEKGLAGHSDADVLLHAIGDALLGAAGLGDLGAHFPDTNEKWKNVSSLIILEEIRKKLETAGYVPVQVDSVLILERPRVAPFVDEMRKKIADALQLPIADVSVKATTTERMGFTGRQEGIAAQAVVLIKRSREEQESR